MSIETGCWHERTKLALTEGQHLVDSQQDDEALHSMHCQRSFPRRNALVIPLPHVYCQLLSLDCLHSRRLCGGLDRTQRLLPVRLLH